MFCNLQLALLQIIINYVEPQASVYTLHNLPLIFKLFIYDLISAFWS